MRELIDICYDHSHSAPQPIHWENTDTELYSIDRRMTISLGGRLIADLNSTVGPHVNHQTWEIRNIRIQVGILPRSPFLLFHA